MRAIVEFKWFSFNRETKIFSVYYDFYENEEKVFWDVELIEMKGYTKIFDCFCWLKNNLYAFYRIIEIEVPFQFIEFKFNKRLKPMGISSYE